MEEEIAGVEEELEGACSVDDASTAEEGGWVAEASTQEDGGSKL
jgi:hypothetical protein